jgi:hypothetical protein
VKKYLVFRKEMEEVGIDICVIEAENAETAKRIFLENYIRRDKTIAECLNESFSQRFLSDQNGMHGIHDLNLPEEEVRKVFVRNVNKFFADRPDYASKYLSECEKDSELMDLPDDMMLFMLLDNPKYLGDIAVVDIQEITIN